MKNSPQLKSICRYCKTAMGGEGIRTSKEHILGESRLKNLGLERCIIHNYLNDIESGTHYSLGVHTAINYWNKGACNKCNNGWMSKLEEEADSTITALFNHTITPQDLTSGQRHILAKWVFKTATAACLNKHLRTLSMPESHFDDAMKGVWPPGAVAFISYLYPDKGTGMVLSGQSDFHGEVVKFDNPIQQYYSFMACYGDIGIGIAFADPDAMISVVLQKDIHQPFFMSAVPFYESIDIKKIPQIPNDSLPIGACAPNAIIFSIGVATTFFPFPQVLHNDLAYYNDSDLSVDDNLKWKGFLIEMKEIGKNFGEFSWEEILKRRQNGAIFSNWITIDSEGQRDPSYKQVSSLNFR